MAPEQEARVRAFYDHERDEPAPGRRRRAAADWGVGDDVFDRMPSRRATRAERHEELEGARFERRASGPARPAADDRREPAQRRDDWADEYERRQVAPRRDDAIGGAAPRRDDAISRAAPRATTAPSPTAPAVTRRPRRPAESWTEGDEGSVEEGKRLIESWLEPERGESRTIVLERAEPAPDVVTDDVEPPARRTVKITGHPDWMPTARSPRAARPPRTALERLGASPDRIVGYAVLLGFLLILIAVLTTG